MTETTLQTGSPRYAFFLVSLQPRYAVRFEVKILNRNSVTNITFFQRHIIVPLLLVKMLANSHQPFSFRAVKMSWLAGGSPKQEDKRRRRNNGGQRTTADFCREPESTWGKV